jgi:hypothetical protein
MTSSTSQNPKAGTGTVDSVKTIPARLTPSDTTVCNGTTPLNTKVRTVQTGRTEGHALLRYSPRTPTIRETSTKG